MKGVQIGKDNMDTMKKVIFWVMIWKHNYFFMTPWPFPICTSFLWKPFPCCFRTFFCFHCIYYPTNICIFKVSQLIFSTCSCTCMISYKWGLNDDTVCRTAQALLGLLIMATVVFLSLTILANMSQQSFCTNYVLLIMMLIFVLIMLCKVWLEMQQDFRECSSGFY